MSSIGLSIGWRDAAPTVDLERVAFWHLQSLAGDEFSSALADGFEEAGDPPFILSWAGVDMELSTFNDLNVMATSFMTLGNWLCWPREPQAFYLWEQGFLMTGTVSLIGSMVEIRAEWHSAYRTPVSSLADCVTMERGDLAREVGNLLRQLETMLLADNRVYVPLSWVCRNLAERAAEAALPS